jgi:hypothetical protein
MSILSVVTYSLVGTGTVSYDKISLSDFFLVVS